MRFLIAGSSGFLGNALRRHLEESGHEVTGLTRGAARPGTAHWDPAAKLPADLVESADVVVNLCGSSLLGNPHARKYAERLRESRITPTRTLAEAIAASEHKPVFLAGNGSSWYGDHGDTVVDEGADSRGESLLTQVTRDWQAATLPASEAGARVCILRTAPVFGSLAGQSSLVTKALGRLFRFGLGGRLGSGEQYFPLISARDWVAATSFLATADVAGPVNLVLPEVPTNRAFTSALAGQLHRPAVLPVPAAIIRPATGPMSGELLNSVRAVPQALTDAGFTFQDESVEAALATAFTRG